MLAVGFPRDAKPLENLLLERYEIPRKKNNIYN